MWKTEDLNDEFNLSCETCLHESKMEYDEPCNMCRNNSMSGVNYYNAKWVEDKSVDHPKHYNNDGAMECIDEMIEVFGVPAVMNFCLCNVWKYRYRAEHKNGNEDFEKSNWYMNKYVDLKERL